MDSTLFLDFIPPPDPTRCALLKMTAIQPNRVILWSIRSSISRGVVDPLPPMQLQVSQSNNPAQYF